MEVENSLGIPGPSDDVGRVLVPLGLPGNDDQAKSDSLVGLAGPGDHAHFGWPCHIELALQKFSVLVEHFGEQLFLFVDDCFFVAPTRLLQYT